ncbi:MAG: DNA-3-methyladenine glycosylase I [Hyphomonadaceae bacterium]|nr:DNA-3-methyladenine glycosylase I [Hyphomonadaceae bacterium]
MTRCGWVDPNDALYCAYHDEEWGVPERDSRALWEKLVLDGFQAGLAWITILRKRETLRAAFDGFDPERVARFDEARVATLLGDPGIIRSRAKIAAAIGSARLYCAMAARGEDFSAYLWDFVDGRPIQNAWPHFRDAPTQTEVSMRLAKDLKARGFKFCGPVIVYAFMQAVGMVNDHETGCPRHAACAACAELGPGEG